MRAFVLFVVASGLMALPGCLAPAGPEDGPGAAQAGGERAPAVVNEGDFFGATSGGAATLAINLPADASKLQVIVEFGPSAFTGFTFDGVPSCGTSFGPGNGAFLQSSQWSGECGATAAGHYDLAWGFSGAAQGHVTVTAFF